jgi:hypothetical protein
VLRLACLLQMLLQLLDTGRMSAVYRGRLSPGWLQAGFNYN